MKGHISSNNADSDLFFYLFDCKFHLQQKGYWHFCVSDEPFLRYSTLKWMRYFRELWRTTYVVGGLKVSEKGQISQKTYKNIKTLKKPTKIHSNLPKNAFLPICCNFSNKFATLLTLSPRAYFRKILGSQSYFPKLWRAVAQRIMPIANCSFFYSIANFIYNKKVIGIFVSQMSRSLDIQR